MKNRICIFILLALLGCQASQQKDGGGEWIQLFNGKDMNDWRMKITGYPLGENYANTFRVEDGKLKVLYDGYTRFEEKFGHLFYKEKFGYYLLGVEYRFVGDQAPGGPGWAIRNSGAMLHSQDPETMLEKQDFPISIEVQFLGGNGQDDRPTANLCTPGTNVVMDGKLFTNHCISSNSKTYHGDQWVRVEVLVLGDSLMEHFIEGQSVLRYEKPQIGAGNVIHYDETVKQDGKPLKEGYIALQSESHPIEFRKVELFNLQSYADDPAGLEEILRKLKVRGSDR
ncbi:MAG TPA: DUF1080 domain-containing protein [Chryseosolibacter sp.]|nr:DUF1080 domain-containing protein [Chryseosolibacter sp.]